MTGINFEKIICVTNRKLCPIPLDTRVGQLIDIGVKNFILREKDLPENEYTLLAERVFSVCERGGARLVIHSFPAAAKALGIKDIHLPLPLLTKEAAAGFNEIGCSVHSIEEARLAEKTGASYLTAGHIFATDCKKDTAPRGPQFLREVCRAANIPVYAIGGITRENMPAALDAGAAAVCVMSGLMSGEFFK